MASEKVRKERLGNAMIHLALLRVAQVVLTNMLSRATWLKSTIEKVEKDVKCGQS